MNVIKNLKMTKHILMKASMMIVPLNMNLAEPSKLIKILMHVSL